MRSLRQNQLSHNLGACPCNRIRLAGICLVLLIFASSLASFGQQQDEYKLGPEDVISVTVMGHSELSGEYLVPIDGRVNVQRAGQISVSGKTMREAGDSIAAGLRDTLLEPEVLVTLKTMRPQLVQALGSVQKPGPYAIKPGWRLTEVIGAAGGLASGTQPADCTISVLRSSDGSRESVLLELAMLGGKDNHVVFAGDVVTVETVETIPIYVMGKVRNPGMYNLRSQSAGVLEALAMAGGGTEEAALSQVTVTHLGGNTETIDALSASEGKTQTPLKLRAGDLVVVQENKSKFAVMGWVARPGFFVLKEGQRVLLSDALSLAGGADTRRGGISRIALLRSGGGKDQRLTFDFGKFTKSGDTSQNPEIQSGDFIWVPETGSPDGDKVWSRITGALSSLWILR
jgi:polysaccharide biosynthesis/export protein